MHTLNWLDKKLDFSKHLDKEINACNEIIGILQKLSPYQFQEKKLLKIYKFFARSNVDYVEMIYEKPSKG